MAAVPAIRVITSFSIVTVPYSFIIFDTIKFTSSRLAIENHSHYYTRGNCLIKKTALNIKASEDIMKNFLKRKNIELSLRRYGVEAMGSMALGLFASLIIGLILSELGKRLGMAFPVEAGGIGAAFAKVLTEMGTMAMGATGYAIGIAVAFGLKAPPLVLFASAATGYAGYALGGPAGSFVAAVIGAEFGKMVSKETKIDIIVTPLVTILCGMGVALLIGPAINQFMLAVGSFINWSTELLPVPMGILVSVVMGMVLTAPISSAALSIMLELDGIAAGAACAGCCANMIGFAVSSYRENKINGLLSQGLGTSMLQVPNIVKNPRIWIPPVVASAVNGPISAALFRMENNASGAGMGTSGLVGQFGALTVMGYSPAVFAQIIFVHVLLPAAISLAVSEFMRKKGWIKPGDMKLEV
jgi:uncharacterized membrane protein